MSLILILMHVVIYNRLVHQKIQQYHNKWNKIILKRVTIQMQHNQENDLKNLSISKADLSMSFP